MVLKKEGGRCRGRLVGGEGAAKERMEEKEHEKFGIAQLCKSHFHLPDQSW